MQAYLLILLFLTSVCVDAKRCQELKLGEETFPPDMWQDIHTFNQFLDTTYFKASHNGTVLRRASPITHGCFNAQFVVSSNLPPKYRKGLFTTPGHQYNAVVRTGNGGSALGCDSRDALHSLSLKVFEVPGIKLSYDEMGTQDFVLLNRPVFIRSSIKGTTTTLMDNNTSPLPASFTQSAHPADDPLVDTYWSTVPFAHGRSLAVKYIITPCTNTPPIVVDQKNCRFLSEAACRRVQGQRGPVACFSFQVQEQTNPCTEPIDDPTVVWRTPATEIGRLLILGQECMSSDNILRVQCENLQFNPWNSVAAHKPLGAINFARLHAYRASSQLRHRYNNAPIGSSLLRNSQGRVEGH